MTHHPTRTENPRLFSGQAARYVLAQNIFSQPQMHHIYDSAVIKQKLTQLINGDEDYIWQQSTSNEFGRLVQGNKYGVKATDTMGFII